MTEPDAAGEADDLDERLAELEALVARLHSDMEDLTAALTTPAGRQDEGTSDAGPEPVYGSVTDWVEQYFCVVFARSVGGEARWCPRWAEHPEAVTRLHALWRSWETLRLDAHLGIATWLTSFADPQASVLFGRGGPFGQCSADRHQRTPKLTSVTATSDSDATGPDLGTGKAHPF